MRKTGLSTREIIVYNSTFDKKIFREIHFRAKRTRTIMKYDALPFGLAIIFAAILSFFSFAAAAAADSLGILIDIVHCHDYSDIGLQSENYEYHHISGSRFGVEYLKSRGIPCDRFTEGRFSDELLAKYKVLAINLVSADCPPFLVSEIQAIVRFVERGGGLFLVTDHSNCYSHAHILEPLLTELEIKTKKSTVCDRFDNVLGNGPGWIWVSRFEPHPITRDLRFLGMQTGGEVDSRFAVAWTSDDAWPDKLICPPYMENVGQGFYGNFIQDPDEPTGRLGVILAKEVGKGRIVIVGDQNMLSDTFLNYGDNYKLWLNSFSWLLDREEIADSEAYHNWKPDWLAGSLWMVEDFDRREIGSDNEHGLYNAWVLLNRHYWSFADDRRFSKQTTADIAVLVDGYTVHSDEIVTELMEHLRLGKNILSLHTNSDVLEDENGTIFRILDALKVDNPAVEKENDFAVIKIPNAGSITLFGGFWLFSNLRIPTPTVAPKEEEPGTIQTLLDAIEFAKKQ